MGKLDVRIMASKNLLIALEVILILVLLISCYSISIKAKIFARDCRIAYNLNDSCPCKQTHVAEQPNSPFQTYNFSSSS
jgi:hypothetical protein